MLAYKVLGSAPGPEQGPRSQCYNCGETGLLKTTSHPLPLEEWPCQQNGGPSGWRLDSVWLLLEERLEGPLTVVKELYR